MAVRSSGANSSTFGFRDRATQKSLKSVLNANRPIGISRAKVTGKRISADRFPQSIGLQWTSFDSKKSWCGRWDSNPQFSPRDGGFKDRCVFRFHHCRINAVGVSRFSGSPLHLSLHLNSCQIRNCSLYKPVEGLPMGGGELQVWSLPLASVRFRNGSAAASSACLYENSDCILP